MRREIVMIPVAVLYPHPENPRLKLGDLTELSESIRKNGVMQNLAVVAGHFMSKEEWVKEARAEGADKTSAEASYRLKDAWVSDGYTVVIGHRRLEAAKMAGLTVLPCVISEMDHREQIATMLEENMQRSDLTVFEQAQGFQMMMDLGYTPEEISEKTGFSRTTVDRRLKMAELDKDTFHKAVGKQITMDVLDRLGQLESVKERNALLTEYGGNNFEWKRMRAIKVQKAKKVKAKARKRLQDAKVEKVPDKDQYNLYSGGYEKLYKSTCELDKWDGKHDFIPKVAAEDGKLLYTESETDIEFYVKKKKKKAEPVRKTPEELEKEKQITLAWQVVDRVTKAAQEKRDEFVQELTVKPSNAMQMLRWTIIAALSDMMHHNYDTGKNLRKALEIEGNYSYEYADAIEEAIMKIPQSDWPGYIQIMFEGLPEKPEEGESFANSYRKDFPKWQRNTRLEQCYKWLTEFGYQMSDEEIRMMGGRSSAHINKDCFQVKI